MGRETKEPARERSVKPDAVLKRLRNVTVGMTTQEHGKLLALEEHHPGWFNATWDHEDRMGNRPTTYSHPGDLMVTVILR